MFCPGSCVLFSLSLTTAMTGHWYIGGYVCFSWLESTKSYYSNRHWPISLWGSVHLGMCVYQCMLAKSSIVSCASILMWVRWYWEIIQDLWHVNIYVLECKSNFAIPFLPIPFLHPRSLTSPFFFFLNLYSSHHIKNADLRIFYINSYPRQACILLCEVSYRKNQIMFAVCSEQFCLLNLFFFIISL